MSKEEKKKSFIYIEFEEVGSVNVVVSNFEGVTAFQLLAMAHLLEFEGKGHLAVEKTAQLQAQMEREQQRKIAVPQPSGIAIGKK